jgi:hypothetical protein
MPPTPKPGAQPATATEGPAARCIVRLSGPSDEDAVARLLSAGFPRWPSVDTDATAIEHLRWKISEPIPSTIVVGEIDGTIAGMSIRSLRVAKIAGREILLQHGFDSCVHPDYRETGVMSVIRGRYQDLLQTHGDLLIYLSKHPAFSKFRVKEGAIPLGTSLRVLLCNEPSFGAAQRNATSWTIEEPARFDERVDAFWTETAAQFDLIIARTQDMLNWRYCDPRAGMFVIRTAEEQGRLLGYAVLRVTNGTGHIADLLALPGRTDVAQSLVVDALDYFQGRAVPSVQCWCATRHPYEQLLASLGFVNKRRTIHLDWVAFTSKPDRAVLKSDRLALHYMAGDTDLV